MVDAGVPAADPQPPSKETDSPSDAGIPTLRNPLTRPWLRPVVALAGLVAFCGLLPVWLWQSYLAEYDTSPTCDPVPDASAATDQMVAVRPLQGDVQPASADVAMFNSAVTVGQYRMITFIASPGNDRAWVLDATGHGYRSLGMAPVREVAAAPDGQTVAVVPGSGNVADAPDRRLGLYDRATGATRWLSVPQPLAALRWSPDGSHVVGRLQTSGPVGGGRATVLVVEPETGRQDVVTLEVAGVEPAYALHEVYWQPDGVHLVVVWQTDAGTAVRTSVHDVTTGAGTRLPVDLAIDPPGLSPSGLLATGTDAVYDLATGAVVSSPKLVTCQDDGIDRSFSFAGWYDERTLIAVQSDRKWSLDQRRGQPRRAELGQRLVLLDLTGEVTRVIVPWTGLTVCTGDFVRMA